MDIQNYMTRTTLRCWEPLCGLKTYQDPTGKQVEDTVITTAYFSNSLGK